jgi:two-component system chemotaxis sensor kinase CheA
MTSARPLEEILDELAGIALLAEPDDEAALVALKEGVAACREARDAAALSMPLASLAAQVAAAQGLGDAGGRADALAAVRRALAALQEQLADGGAPASAPGNAFVLPEWVEEAIFEEFIAGHELVLEELEAEILAVEKGGSGALASLRRRLHSLKGEVGVLGLEEVERVCHTLEDHLEEQAVTAELTDRLLAVKDWLGEALRAYGRRELPTTAGDAVLAALLAKLPASAAAPAVEAPPEAPASEAPAWDAETIELANEFLQESEDGLTQVDEILLAADEAGVALDEVNAIFRVFHTMKGVAGFLELSEITKLAHTSETLLDQGRKGTLEIKGSVIDLLFDATALLRRMLTELREAMSRGRKPASEAELPALIARLEARIAGQVEEEQPPVAGAGERVGEILSREAVDPAAVAAVLTAQQASGRRLGEELLAQGTVTPKQVSQAVRAQGQAGATKLTEFVKVDLERVDSLVSLIGELVIVESMVANAPELGHGISPRLRSHISQMSKITNDLQNIGTRMRMVPVRGVFQKMARMVRDLSRNTGKLIGVETTGEGTEMDRGMVEKIADPLVHMIRNAVDHGIEDKAGRAAAGKPVRGTIKLRAYHEGGSVVIQVADDGRGLNRDAILAKARDKGLVKEGDELTDHDIYNLIFAPGFSTAKQITEISGRGVGMDVVRRNIEAVRGRVKIDSVPGEGSTFTMLLPLTLAVIDGMLIACGAERYIIPTLSVVESIRPEAAMIFSITGKGEIVNLRGETIPLFRLDRLLNIPDAEQVPTQALVVVVESHGRKLGLLVDDVLTQQQVVIKGLGEGLPGTRYLSGAAILSDGCVGLILNTHEIASLVDESTFHARRPGGDAPHIPATPSPRGRDTRMEITA